MNNYAMKRLKVAIVPSWMSELVALSPDLNYSDLLCYASLLEEKSSILSEEQIIIYALTQANLNGLTENAFKDMPLVGESEANLNFLTDRARLVSKIEDTIKIREAQLDNPKDALNIAPIGLGAKEFYSPLMITEDVLLLIGSVTPVYKDPRAFYNAVLETVGNKSYYAEFKQYEFFRYYLRYAVTN